MAKPLRMDLLNKAVLRRMAGGQSFARGEDYFAGGRVKDVFVDDQRLDALVIGSRKYRVRLWVENEAVQHSCTCPMGEAGNFCKHCVAAAMAYLAESGGQLKTRSKPAERVTMQDARTMLLHLDHEFLVEMILGWAESEDRLRERLLLAAAKQSKMAVNLAKFRHAIEVALEPGNFIDYHDMPSYARDADEVIDHIEDLRRDGHAEAAIELSEYALQATERAMNSMDDSDGYMRGILDRLQEIHVQAARRCGHSGPLVGSRRLRELEKPKESWYLVENAAPVAQRLRGIRENHKEPRRDGLEKSKLEPGRFRSDN
jgi:uncharacterized Zn finger protein